MIKIVFLSFFVTGCTLFVNYDYFSQRIARIDTSKSGAISVETILHKGRNELHFYARGYDCNSPLIGNIVVSINVGGNEKITDLKLSELTWPRRGSDYECVPLGFYNTKNGRPFSIVLENKEKVIFNFKNDTATSGSIVEVWVAYDSRLSLQYVEKHRARIEGGGY